MLNSKHETLNSKQTRNNKSQTLNVSSFEVRVWKKIIAVMFFCLMIYGVSRAYASGSPEQPKEPRLITLSQGIEMVLKDNRLIKSALPDNEIAFQESLRSRSVLFPQVSVFAEKIFSRYPPAIKFGDVAVETGDKNPLNYGIDIYQTLFDFGKNLSNYRASKELYKAIEAHTESVKRIAVLEFVTAYFNLLEADKMILVLKKESESLTSYLSDIEHLYEEGVVVKNDLLPARVSLADVKQRLIAARNAREVALARLNNILALPLNENLVIQDINMQPMKAPEISNAWDIASKQRPEITFYSDQINASSFSERAKLVENWPTLFLDTGYAYNQNRYVIHEANTSINFGVKMDLFDGGLARADLLKERARGGQLKEQKEKLIEDIKFEIEDSYFGFKNASEKIAVAKDSLEEADENVRFYRVKYAAGSATPTDVLGAISLQTRAQVNYCSSEYELKRSYAKLMYSMGIDLALIYEVMDRKHGDTAKTQNR